ncbi:MAG: glycosyltransferase [bacterium]|nr:glycosyltransferase [bacterium]
MHILHVIDSLEPGGAERMAVDLANATTAAGHQATVCVTRTRADLADELRPEVGRLILGRTRRFDVRRLRRLATRVRQDDIDVLHAHSRSSFALLGALRILGWLDRPILLHDHFGSIEIDSSVPWWFRPLARRYLAGYVGVYARLGEWAAEAGVPRHRIGVIENAMDLDRIERCQPLDLRRELSIPDSRRIGIVVCGIRPEKGIDVLLEAVAGSRHRREFQILVVGGARDQVYRDACQERADALGLGNRVLFLGEQRNVIPLIKGADFAVIPSLSESGPLVLIEYLAAGLPIVASRAGAIARRVEELGVPAFVSPGEPEELHVAIDSLLDLSPEERRSRAALGPAIARRHFAVEGSWDRWHESYRRVLGESPE